MSSRFMRLVLFFDLPVIKTSQRKAYTKFVKDIKKIGFYMLQESVYIKMCLGTSFFWQKMKFELTFIAIYDIICLLQG